MNTDHIVMGGRAGETCHCRRCGVGLTLTMPVSLNVFLGASEGFIKDHAGCQPGLYMEPEVTRANWAVSRDTGISSATIFGVLGNQNLYEEHDVPHDAADFGRCHRLLKLYPEWRERLSEVADRYPAWKPLLDHWGELEAAYERELIGEDIGATTALITKLRHA